MTEALELGRYTVFAELASGGMATVYLGRMKGAAGFGRTVAIKRLHPHLARDPDFVSMFLDEARLAARVQHPNVVPTLDVVSTDRELFLVLEYVKGETLGALLRAAVQAGRPMPVPVALSVLVDVLNGLHAAHEAKDEQGTPLEIVHRDVSPQNVIVGSDGVARLLDFGVAKAASRLQTTLEGQIKGKVAYMAPEQVTGKASRQSDIYAAGVVLWESLALRRLFNGNNEAQLLHAVLFPQVVAPSWYNPEGSRELDQVVMKALAPDPAERYQTAREMALALDACMRPASSNQVAEWLESMAGAALHARSQLVAECESHSGNTGRSEVRKLLEMNPAAALAGASIPGVSPESLRAALDPAPGAPLGAPMGTGASVVNASLSLMPGGAGESPGGARSRWVVAGSFALALAGGGLVIFAARGPSRDVAPASAAAPGAVPEAPQVAVAATVAPPRPPPTAPPIPPPVEPPPVPSAAPTPSVAEVAVSALPPAPPSPSEAPGAAHIKKPTGVGPRPHSGDNAAGNMNSLLDSH